MAGAPRATKASKASSTAPTMRAFTVLLRCMPVRVMPVVSATVVSATGI